MARKKSVQDKLYEMTLVALSRTPSVMAVAAARYQHEATVSEIERLRVFDGPNGPAVYLSDLLDRLVMLDPERIADRVAMEVAQ